MNPYQNLPPGCLSCDIEDVDAIEQEALEQARLAAEEDKRDAEKDDL